MSTATALKLQDAGFSQQQVDALVERETVTKADLVAAEAHLENKIDRVIAEVRAEIIALRAELKADIAGLRAEIKWTRLVGAVSLTVSLATLGLTISIASKIFS